jgi:hypothetical protein
MTTVSAATETPPRPGYPAYQKTFFISLVITVAINLLLLYGGKAIGLMPKTLDSGTGSSETGVSMVITPPAFFYFFALSLYALIRRFIHHAFRIFGVLMITILIFMLLFGYGTYYDISIGTYLLLCLMEVVNAASFLWVVRRYLR